MNWLSFTNPWLLAGLAGVGLPVLIHYLTRARPRRVSFPPFKFLQEACAGQQAVHRLRTFLLLSIRTLAVLALVLWFARPFLKPAGANAAERAHRVVLLLDASLSMRAAPHGMPLFAHAKAEAAEVLRGLDPETDAAVILVGATPRSLLPALSRNLPALHDGLVKAEAGCEFGDFPAALALAQRLLGGSGIIYLFSDFQKSNWEPVRELPGGVVCRLRPVTTEPVENLALTSARMAPEEPVAGENAEVICTVFNCTPRPRQQTVRLEMAGLIQERQVTAPAFGTAAAGFPVAFPREGVFTGKAWIEADDLREDDTRYLATRVHQALTILLLSDAEENDPRSAAFFLARALRPTAQAAPGFNLVRRHSQDADRGILETADVFILVPPASPSGEALEVMTRRVREGGRFMAVIDGPSAATVVPPGFNPPFQLLRPTTSDAGDPLIPGPRKLFADVTPDDWAGLRVRRHYLTQPVPERAGEVMLAYPDGSAAVTFSPVGQGAAVFLNLPLTPEAGDFVGHPLFPSALHELLRALRRGAEEKTITPGEAWTLDVSMQGDAPLSVTGPDGRAVEARVLSSGRTARLALSAARLPGIFEVRQNGVLAGAAAVNIDSRESDTRPLALEDLKPGAASTVSVVRTEEELAAGDKARHLWPLLAEAVAAMLAVEMLLLALWATPAGANRPAPTSADRRKEAGA